MNRAQLSPVLSPEPLLSAVPRLQLISGGKDRSLLRSGDPAPPGGLPAPALQNAVDRPRILLAEDDENLRSLLQVTLRSSGLDVLACGSAEEAEQLFLSGLHFDLLLTDLEMPGHSGAWLAASLRAHTASLPVLIVSGADLDQTAVEEFAGQGWCFLSKPFHLPQILSQIEALLAPAHTCLPPADGRHTRFAESRQPPIGIDGNHPENPSAEPDSRPLTFPASGSKGRVLLIGGEPTLLQTRTLLLRSAGYAATSKPVTDGLDGTDFTGFDLVLLCSSVPTLSARHAAQSIHAAAPHLPILRFTHLDAESIPGVHRVLQNVTRPAALLAEVHRLLHPSA